MIAILGATGYIGLSLARAYAVSGRPLALFARNPERLAAEAWPATVSRHAIESFTGEPYDLVVNCLGAGDPARVAALGDAIGDVTQRWDEAILASLPAQGRYVFLSSGIVHAAATNPDTAASPYAAAKLAAERRHRERADCAILDIRVFGYADRAIDLRSRFFLAELARSVVERTVFRTTRADMIRDYAGVDELATLIERWQAAGAPNLPLDLYTAAPVEKLRLLEEARRRYGLVIEYVDSVQEGTTGAKPVYAATARDAERLGYVPTRDALTVVLEVLEAIRRQN